jgi:eukaryotic-like serine/threonine-protein kinase
MDKGLPRNEVRGAPDLAGKYRLIAELGQGGMATVYLAVVLGRSGFRKLAVVKLLRPEIGVDAEFVQMFLDEAKLCARLSHPNIVHIYDVGVDDVGHLMAMEYLDGVSLHAAVAKLAKNGGPFTFPLQAKVLLEVVEGLRYAHELRDYDGRSLEIVHRDVTPHNIFVTYDGQVKLLDFGIAKAATSSVRTATGVIKGKLTYMAPEQARGEPVDARADLYAVGVMLWEAVTGRRRWPTGLSQPALFTRLASGEPPESPNAASMGYPAEIDAIVLKTLAPKPEDRYQTAAELRDALDGVLRKMEPVSLRDLGGLLSNAFAEGRQRLHDVIEEQFRLMDSGERAAELRPLPAVAPAGATGSGLFDASAAGGADKAESQSVRMTAPALERSALSQSRRRSRVAIGVAAAALGVAALAIGITATRAHTSLQLDPASSSPPAASPAALASPPVPAPSPLGSDLAQDAQGRSQTPSLAVDAAPMAESARQFRPTSPAVPSSTKHGTAAPAGPGSQSPAIPAPAPAPAPSPSPSPPPAATAAEPAPLRRPGDKPKVQLERDNPWP